MQKLQNKMKQILPFQKIFSKNWDWLHSDNFEKSISF